MKNIFIYPLTYIIYITLFFAVGISLAFVNQTFIYISLTLAFTLIIISIILALKKYYYISLIILILSSLFIGYSYTITRYYDIFKNPLNTFDKPIKAYNAKILSYDGVVGFRDRYIAYVDKVYDGTNWYNYAGNIRLYNSSLKPIYINDEITVSSKLNLYKNILTNDDIYDSKTIIKVLSEKMLYGAASIYPYNNFVVQKEGFSIINYINAYALKIRNIIKKSLGENIDAIPYTIAQGIMIGDKNIIPYHIRKYFIDSGISHILSISGLHISMILSILYLILSFFHLNFYKRILISAIITVIIYPPITLFSVSIIRASIMAVCFTISYYFDRNRNSVNALFLSALIILLLNPNSIKDISFQFSFLATLGIILYYPIINFYVIKNIKNINTNNKVLEITKSIIIKSLSFLSINVFALIIVLPLSIYHFSILNLTSIIANIFAVPLSFIILSSSIITIVSYVIFSPISVYPALTVEFCSSLLIDLAKKFSNISFLKYDIKLNLYHALFITFIIALIGIILRIKINKINTDKKTS
ncbi:ComEC/Rec2 family competence protein [Brachyspira murdochii]|uniref:ComEC/Rec2-related protein n=1 Tax=Brachyspira murdochii (strain ATCC 51284 / DSM 12563 / 56-150) TaxID=526224 RepID=D5U685_BRAM5|nr:ComEC/Rec2 family competence protein [Brachyspira murdochii]ADG72584.1 ComEC/Rec2-related protein [Brachyspira murdochii DSM 12563]